MNVVVNINNKDNLEEYTNLGIKHFIIGLKGYNVNASLELDIKQIKEILNKYDDIELFISMDKNIFNSELDDLKKKLKELEKLNIKAVLFYDLAILNIIKENNIKLDLVWNQTYMVTNYNTCNYYHGKGIKYGYISWEITIDEIIEISKKTSMELLVPLVGYPPLSLTRRKLLTNFYKTNSIKEKNNEQLVTERDKSFIIKEDKVGTKILGGNIVNGTRYLPDLTKSNIPYIVLNEYNIEKETFTKVLKNIIEYLKKPNQEYLLEIEKLIGTNTHFFNKKTIYKVK